MTPPRVIFVNRFYWPDQPATAQLLTDLAEGLAGSGYAVTVVARRPSPSVPLVEMHHGVQIQRVRTSAWGRHSLAGRTLDFATFLLGARRLLRTQLRSQDVLVTLTDPPMLGPALAGVVRRRGAHWIHWIQDIFPEVAAAVAGRTLVTTLIPWRDRSWRTANRCIIPGYDMAELVHQHGVPSNRLTVSENWSPVGLRPTDSADWRRQQGLEGRFIVMYSGNLGRVHDFSAIVPLVRALGPASGVTFVFVGDGGQKAALENHARAERLENVLFLPAQPREDLAAVLSAGDLHLVTLRAGCENLVYPSKIYGIAAVGRPALVIGPRDCEPGRTVSTHRFGAGYMPDEIAAMVEFIQRLQSDPTEAAAFRQAALRFSQSHGQLSHALAKWTDVLTPLIQLAKTGKPAAPFRSTP